VLKTSSIRSNNFNICICTKF